MKKKNVIFIIIISIVLILTISSGVFAFLFMTTDIFKSSQELFAKYFTQNIEIYQKMIDLKTVETYKNLENENKLESNTSLEVVYSEGGEISSPLNNLTAKIDLQKDDENQYIYIDGQILYEDEEYLETEIIKEQDIYGIRFTDVVKQFVTVKNDENIETILNELGINPELFALFTNFVEESELPISTEQIESLKNNFWGVISREAQNAVFEKQKNVVLEVNNIVMNTNAYSLFLSGEQVKTMSLEMLNHAKAETEKWEDITKEIDEIITQINEKEDIPTVKVTVFEEKQKVVQTIVEIGTNKIVIQTRQQDDGIIVNMLYSNSNSELKEEYNLQIVKKNVQNQEDIQMVLDVTKGEENYTITFSNIMQLLDNQIQCNIEISHEQNITTKALKLENKVTIGSDYEKIDLSKEGTSILMNSLQEQKRKQLIDILKVMIPEKINERIDILKAKLGLQKENEDTENNMTQVEINKFNAQFEFYTGEEVSSEKVKTLLDIVKNNLKSHEIVINEQEENSENTTEIIKLNIEKDVINEEEMNKVIEKIENNKTYKVSIFYEQSNGLIDYITINPI